MNGPMVFPQKIALLYRLMLKSAYLPPCKPTNQYSKN
jgi:hypothetical protein